MARRYSSPDSRENAVPARCPSVDLVGLSGFSPEPQPVPESDPTMKIGSVSTSTPVEKAPEQARVQRQQPDAAKVAKSVANAVTSATQEALETTAQTKKEAASGDQQAVRKLAQQAQNTNQSNVARSLNVKA